MQTGLAAIEHEIYRTLVGSHICDKLLQAGHFLRIFERPRVPPYRGFLDSEDVEWLTGDLLSIHDVSQAMQGVDAIFHLVSTTLPKNSNDDPIFDVQTNIISSLQIINLMISLKIPKIVFISSRGTVYGTPVSLPIHELHATNPHVSYGITKLAIEKYLLLYEKLNQIKPVILRVSNPYGERQRIETAQGAVGVFVSRALKGEPVEIWGTGSVVRDYIYVDDVANAFIKALNYSGNQSIFNIGSGAGTSLNQLLDNLEIVLDTSIQRIYHPGRPYDVPINILDNNLALDEMGWSPKVELKDGLFRVVNWMRTQI